MKVLMIHLSLSLSHDVSHFLEYTDVIGERKMNLVNEKVVGRYCLQCFRFDSFMGFVKYGCYTGFISPM